MILDVSINNQKIKQVSSFKLLGVTVTENLSWSLHITDTCSRAKKMIGLIYRIFGGSGSSTLNHLYKATVRPLLDYASSIWDPIHKVHSLALERTQNFAARVTLNSWSWNTDPSVLKTTLGWSPLQQRRLFQKICLCRRILTGQSILPPSTFSIHPKPTRSHNNSFPLSRPLSEPNIIAPLCT